MKHLKTHDQFLNESKNLADLYHYTSFYGLYKILTNNILKIRKSVREYDNEYFNTKTTNIYGGQDTPSKLLDAKQKYDCFLKTLQNKNKSGKITDNQMKEIYYDATNKYNEKRNKIKDGLKYKHTLSLTRDSNFIYNDLLISGSVAEQRLPVRCKIVFDAEKLNEKYRIKPFDYDMGNSYSLPSADLSLNYSRIKLKNNGELTNREMKDKAKLLFKQQKKDYRKNKKLNIKNTQREEVLLLRKPYIKNIKDYIKEIVIYDLPYILWYETVFREMLPEKLKSLDIYYNYIKGKFSKTKLDYTSLKRIKNTLERSDLSTSYERHYRSIATLPNENLEKLITDKDFLIKTFGIEWYNELLDAYFLTTDENEILMILK